MSHCLTTTRMAEQLGLGGAVCNPLQQVFARWDGKGVPVGVGGEGIAAPARLFHLADSVEVFHRGGGIDAAVDVARSGEASSSIRWSSTPSGAAGEVLANLDAVADWSALIDTEPSLQRRLSCGELDVALEAIADFTDLRSPSRAGHSRAVAALATRAAELCGLPADEVGILHRAALVHDLGLHGVPASILDKPGPLNATESERMRMHAYYTERILARPAALARIGAIAALADERLDGSGYHRGLSGPAIVAGGRILAAADAYQAMTEPRPHRSALSVKTASNELHGEARVGRLAADAVDAVLAAAGQRAASVAADPPASVPARSRCSR
jgi:HD-GYP domain-containing protein (c-di-GMP phosphodiesterase class II)